MAGSVAVIGVFVAGGTLEELLQARQIDRFGEVVVEAGFLGAPTVLVLTISGDRYQQLAARRLATAAVRAKGSSHFVAIHAGQTDVEENDIGPVLLGRDNGRGSVESDTAVETPEVEEVAQAFSCVAVVIHHQHPKLS